MTLRDRVIEKLKARGCRELPSPSRKYRKFTYPQSSDRFYWVGKAGALRIGRTVGESFSVSSAMHFALKKETINGKAN